MHLRDNLFALSQQEALELYNLFSPSPDVDFKSAEISCTQWAPFIDAAQHLPWADRLRDIARRELSETSGAGFLIIDGLFPSSVEHINDRLKIATAVCGVIGRPLKVMDKLGLWLDVPVKLNVDSFRFGGTGYNPLHIDVVNATNPPDVVVLLGDRLDPLGGGESLVSNLKKALEMLSLEDKELLKQPSFRDGKLVNMSNVGVDYNPFPVIGGAGGFIRFSAKMLHTMEDGEQRQVIKRLHDRLAELQEPLMLIPGRAVVLNQRVVAHGRTPLGDGQETLDPSSRRLLHQLYLRL